MISKYGIGKDLEGHDSGVIWGLKRLKKTKKIIRQNSWCPSRD
jgi:hypothetical protein